MIMRKYEITKEQIRLIEHQSVNMDYGQVARDMREWFPDAFKFELEIGKWYVYPQIPEFITFIKPNFRRYGIGTQGAWFDDSDVVNNTDGYKEATYSEVSDALLKEAIKRGFIKGSFYKSVSTFTNGDIVKLQKDVTYYSNRNMITDGCNGAIFEDGIWATLVPTKTKEQAEKELNCKIID